MVFTTKRCSCEVKQTHIYFVRIYILRAFARVFLQNIFITQVRCGKSRHISSRIVFLFCSSYVYHQRHPFDSKQANGKMQSRKRFLRRIRNIHRRTRFVHRKFGDYNNVNSGVAQLYSDYFCRSDKHALSNTYAACVVIYIGIFGISRQPLGQKKIHSRKRFGVSRTSLPHNCLSRPFVHHF